MGGLAGVGGRAGSGVAGAGGRGGSGPSGPVTPTKVGKHLPVHVRQHRVEIDPQTGGRVSKLALGGADLVMPAATDPTTWGSVFWTSPRAEWTPTTNDWPPPAAIDNAAYSGSISGTHVIVTGPTDSTLGVNMKKDYAADLSGWLNITYTINATKAIKASPWEVSRVPRGGIVFFPVGASLNKGPLPVTQSASGIAWFDDAAMTATSPNGDKCYADGQGWTAYAVGGNLFLKKFTDVPATAQATGEGEIDIYPGNGFLESRCRAPTRSSRPGGNLPWSIKWKIVKLPSSVTRRGRQLLARRLRAPAARQLTRLACGRAGGAWSATPPSDLPQPSTNKPCALYCANPVSFGYPTGQNSYQRGTSVPAPSAARPLSPSSAATAATSPVAASCSSTASRCPATTSRTGRRSPPRQRRVLRASDRRKLLVRGVHRLEVAGATTA